MHSRVFFLVCALSLRVLFWCGCKGGITWPTPDGAAGTGAAGALAWCAGKAAQGLAPRAGAGVQGDIATGLLVFFGESVLAGVMNDFCNLAYAHNKTRRDIVFCVVAGSPALLMLGHVLGRPLLPLCAALCLFAVSLFWKGHPCKAVFCYAALVALDHLYLYLAPVFFAFFAKCVWHTVPLSWGVAAAKMLACAAVFTAAACHSLGLSPEVFASKDALAELFSGERAILSVPKVAAEIVYSVLAFVCLFSFLERAVIPYYSKQRQQPRFYGNTVLPRCSLCLLWRPLCSMLRACRTGARTPSPLSLRRW